MSSATPEKEVQIGTGEVLSQEKLLREFASADAGAIVRFRTADAQDATQVVIAAATAGLLLLPGNTETFFVIQKPHFQQGAKQALPKKVPVQKRRILLDLDDDESGEIGFVDENSLLQGEDFARPSEDDCETSKDGTRKACKNCSCGRAEEEAAGNAPAKKTAVQASSCGNCYLGDAFRCASCPSLGKPAFRPGQENVVLDLTDDI